MSDEAKRKEVFEWRRCINILDTGEACRRKFYISVAEKEYFEAKQNEVGKPFTLPKRCYPCRVKRREQGSNNGTV